MIFKGITTLAEVMEIPQAEEILLKHNVPCLGCPMAKLEMKSLTIEQICATYGIDCTKLIGDLNRISKKGKSKK